MEIGFNKTSVVKTIAPGASGTPEPSVIAENASKMPSARVSRPSALTDAGRLAIALRADFAQAADAVSEVLNIEDEAERKAKAKEVLSKIDSLVPNDPIMAGVIADTMEREFLKEVKQE